MKKKALDNFVVGKNTKPMGISPAIALVNPKFAHNVGAAVRAASCFGFKQVWYTGDRVSMELTTKGKGERLPREERMKDYQDVELRQYEKFFDCFESDVVPVAIEIRPNAEVLSTFEHPEKAVYVFGPEDGGLHSVHLRHCHRVVVIPTKHCTNLAAAVYITLYDRLMKRQQLGLEPIIPASEILDEDRGWLEPVLYDKKGLHDSTHL